MDILACAKPALALHTLRERLMACLGPDFGVACTGVDGDPQALYPEELAAIQRAVPRRQREFAAGREAARLAMAQIGWPAMPIPSAPDRSPVWPEGLAGSITHSARVCVAVVCRREHRQAIGIDLEEDRPMEQALWSTICTPAEHVWVAAQPAPLQGTWVTRLFSAKEAFYKWQYPQTGQMLEFQEVQAEWNMQTQGFDIRLASVKHTRLCAYRGTGQFLISSGQVVAWLVGPRAL